MGGGGVGGGGGGGYRDKGGRSGGGGSGKSGNIEILGGKLIFNRKFSSEKMAHNKYCFRPISHIKVHYGKHAPLLDQNDRNLVPNA